MLNGDCSEPDRMFYKNINLFDGHIIGEGANWAYLRQTIACQFRWFDRSDLNCRLLLVVTAFCWLGESLAVSSGSGVEGCFAIHSRALWIAGGIGGGVGTCVPATCVPNSSAVQLIAIGVPSGALYWTDPWISWVSDGVPAYFRLPVSVCTIPPSVSKLNEYWPRLSPRFRFSLRIFSGWRKYSWQWAAATNARNIWKLIAKLELCGLDRYPKPLSDEFISMPTKGTTVVNNGHIRRSQKIVSTQKH